MTTTRAAASDQNATVAAGFLGWMLDAFDFFLVVMTLTAIGKEFGKSDAAIAFSITLTLAFRPVGAFIFGLLADRYGRKIPLMVDLVFYSVIEVLSGLAPHYVTFLVLRALFGIGVGAGAGGSFSPSAACRRSSPCSCAPACRSRTCGARPVTTTGRAWDGRSRRTGSSSSI